MADYLPMDQKIKAEWIAALRGEKYKQIKGCLHDDGGYCCLGVLCEIVGGPKWEDHGLTYFFDGDDTMPPDTIKDRAGIGEEVAEKFAAMNDNDGKSFAEIADFIEKNL